MSHIQPAIFVLTVALVLWFVLLIGMWFPPWPTREEVSSTRQRIRALRGGSAFRFAVALILNSYFAYPVSSALIAFLLFAISLAVIK